jgi:oxygen-independent coproporphyrinogen-3 oxidase
MYEEYFKTLRKEITERAKQYGDREVQTIYIGGGTPNLVPHQFITEFIENIKKNFKMSKGCEVTIELYPEYIEGEQIKAYLKAGINRLSIGLQSTDNEDLKRLSRRYTYEEFLDKYKIIKTLGFKDVGVDLIFGYPEHTLKKWEDSLELITNLDIQHISCYSLEIEEGTPYFNLFESDKLNLPTEISNRKMYHYTCKYLGKKGFKQYEISNFAKDGYECRHNLNFWNYEDYLGLGAGAYSRVDNTKSNNPENIQEYISGKWEINKEGITPQIESKEKVILGLRLNKGVPYEEKLYKKEYMDKRGEYMTLNSKGKDLYNTVITSILN